MTNQRRILRRHKRFLGVPRKMRASRIARLRAETLMKIYEPVPDRWFWYRWLLISLHALERIERERAPRKTS